MRGLHEHAQTRFYSFFALSLSATMGVAFFSESADHLFFYEMLFVSTFPLVTHMQDKGGKNGRAYLFRLPAFYFTLPASARTKLVLHLAGWWPDDDGLHGGYRKDRSF